MNYNLFQNKIYLLFLGIYGYWKICPVLIKLNNLKCFQYNIITGFKENSNTGF